MASTHKSLRSGTADKRPTTSIADGQIALNTNSTSPGLFFKDSTGATIIKVGPVHVGSTAPNATPTGSAGNSVGEVWLDNSLTPVGVKIWDNGAWTNATPAGSTTVQGLLELATDAETQAGVDTARAVTPAGLQSKVSDSVSTASSTTIASSAAVKTAYDLAASGFGAAGGTIQGNLIIGSTGTLSFEGATDDGFETLLDVVDPTADNTITLPDVSGTVVTTGDTGTVTSTMIANGTIANADINASAAIADTKLATISTAGKVSNSATTATSANTASAIVARDASGNFSAGTVTAALSGNASTATTLQTARTINGTSFNGSANITTASWGTARTLWGQSVDGSANETGPLRPAAGSTAAPAFSTSGDTDTGIYSPSANVIGFVTGGTRAANFDSSGNLQIYNTAGTYYHNFSGQPTANRTITLPDANTTLVSGTMVPTTGTGATGSWGISVTGNAATATTLATARTINGTSFNGSANITTASWGTGRTFTFNGDVSGSTAGVDGAANETFTLTLASGSVSATQLGQSGSAPVYAARAWVNFNGTGTVAIRNDGNVTSITDNGVGIYTVNLTTAMPTINYAIVATAGETARAMNVISDWATRTSSTNRIVTFSSVNEDSAYVSVIFIH